jgi:pSer/pThr/pTyr-binding forkhead associated (FHA) protein
MATLEVWDPWGETRVQLDDTPKMIGRDPGCDLVFEKDRAVSRRHAILEPRGGAWLISDLNSRNGTWVNGQKVFGGQALRDRDEIIVGEIRIIFHDGARTNSMSSTAPLAERPKLTPAQQRTLVELVRPILRRDKPVPGPASVDEIARALFVGRGAVQANLSALYDKFGILPDPDGRQDRRWRLSNEAIQRASVRFEDLDEPDEPGAAPSDAPRKPDSVDGPADRARA